MYMYIYVYVYVYYVYYIYYIDQFLISVLCCYVRPEDMVSADELRNRLQFLKK